MDGVFVPGLSLWKHRSPLSGQDWGQIEQKAQLLFQTQLNLGCGPGCLFLITKFFMVFGTCCLCVIPKGCHPHLEEAQP
jgi:hypothetical protein